MAAVTAGQTVLAPNTELAAALFDAVERHHLEAGRDVWPTPRVLDFGSWLRERHADRQLRGLGAPRVLGDTEERELWREVIASSGGDQDILEPTAAARAARRARRTVEAYGIPLRAVAEHGSASPEASAFLHWNRLFDERCRALECIGADALLLLTPPPADPISWIESPAWRPMARQWLLRHGPMLAPAIHPSRAAVRLHAASPAAELAAIADWALENLRCTEDFRAWVCIPDLDLRRAEAADAFDAALAPQRFSLSESAGGVPYALAGGTPLADFAPVRAALAMLGASVDSISFERFSGLLRSPELHASPAEASAAARLDVLLRKHGPYEADLAAWLTAADRIATAHKMGAVAGLRRLDGALRALAELRGNHPVSRWVTVWVHALDSGPWSLRHRWSSFEYQAAERFRELLAQLGTADAVLGSHSRLSAQQILRRAAHDTVFQPQTGIPPVWVSGQAMDPWLNYAGLWVSGCSGERWPPPVEPVALLPVTLQRDFGVIAAAPESQLHFALELQSRWAARAGQCVFSYADPGDGRAAAPSPLLPLEAAPLATALPRPHWHALLQAQPVLGRFTDEIAPAFGLGERTRGVSTLRAQSRCAFRGFAETRLRTDRLERPVPGFNDRERGDLVHHALEHVWERLRDSRALLAITPEAQARLLDEGITRSLAKVCRSRDPGPRATRRERERLRNLLSKWLDIERRRQPFEVEHLEAAHRMRHAGVEFAVRIDRVDRLADGARVLIDYKTGKAVTDWRGERPDNPQLPIYALLRPAALVGVAYGHVNAAGLGFVAEAERPAIFKPRGRETALEGMGSLAALIGVWSQRVEKLAADFAAGRAAVAPTVRACKSCHLQGLCRVPAALEDAAQSHD